MDNEDLQEEVKDLKTWFKDLFAKFKKAGYEFHCYNWIIPAIFPFVAALIGFFINSYIKPPYYSIFMGFACQLLYFSFFTLIINMAIINKKHVKNKKNNDFVTSFIIALLTIFIYIPLSNNYYLEQPHYSMCRTTIICVATLVIFIFSIMLYSKYCESFNENNPEDLATEFSKNKEQQDDNMDKELE